MNIKSLLKKYKKRTLFTTPSHNQGEFIIPYLKKVFGKKFFQNDFSEIIDFDNLKNPQFALKDSMENSARIYGVKNTFYLTNGSTQGVLAVILSFLKYNDLIIIAKNCHQSVYDAVYLAQARAIVLEQEIDTEWGVYKPILPEQLENIFINNPAAKGFVLSCPYYEGIISDIEKLSKICKKYEKLLIVDEAHGALWNFDKTIATPSAFLGADAVIQSLHKTCGALNQCSLLHIPQNSKLQPEIVKETLNKLTTSSPSYPLLLCIEQTIEFLNSLKGKKIIDELISNIHQMKKRLEEYQSIKFYSKNCDETKLLVKIDGISGYELSERMYKKFKIEDELANETSVLYLTGIGTTKQKLKKLEKALISIANDLI